MKKLKFNKGINEIKNEQMEKLNARDQMLKIINTIWSSRQPEQIKGCEKMLETYIKENGNENIGVTFIQVEISRQIRLNGLFAKMGKVQDALQKQNAENAGKQKFDKPLNEDELKAHNIKRIEAEQTKIMREKIAKEKKDLN